MRSTLSPAFTGSKMRQMFDLVTKVGKESTMTLKNQIMNGSINNEIEFKSLANKFAVDNIATCAFGIEVNSFEKPDNPFQDIATEFANFASVKSAFKFAGYLLVPWLMSWLKISFISEMTQTFFEKTILENIRTREEKGIYRNDMINLLIQAKRGKLKHEVKEEGNIVDGFATVEESQIGKSQNKREWEDIGKSPKELNFLKIFDFLFSDLAAQCFIFFIGGFDTVSTTISFMAYELMKNQEVQLKLYEEILQTEEELNGEVITYEKIQSMKYLDQVVSEVLRMWPAAPGTDRICVKDYNFDFNEQKFTFDKDKNFFIPIYGFHQFVF